jgi:hypothetical protein
MNIGTLVYQENQGNLRFGTITGKELDEKGWAHFAVDWHDDGCHYRAMDWTSKLRNDGIDRHDRHYRSDELTVVAVKHLEKSVVAHMLLHRPRLSSERELPVC